VTLTTNLQALCFLNASSESEGGVSVSAGEAGISAGDVLECIGTAGLTTGALCYSCHTSLTDHEASFEGGTGGSLIGGGVVRAEFTGSSSGHDLVCIGIAFHTLWSRVSGGKTSIADDEALRGVVSADTSGLSVIWAVFASLSTLLILVCVLSTWLTAGSVVSCGLANAANLETVRSLITSDVAFGVCILGAWVTGLSAGCRLVSVVWTHNAAWTILLTSKAWLTDLEAVIWGCLSDGSEG